MSATNATANYELPVFLATDKPAWLTDWNGAMNAIDTAIHTAQSTADGAQTTASTATTDIATINSSLTTITSNIQSLTTTVNGNTGSINTINSLIGNGQPTTEDKTIIGAINEIYAMIGGGSTVTADVVTYDNTTSGLTADDVQEAIDEIVTMIPSGPTGTYAKKPTVVSGTLTAGQTSLTLSDASIVATSLIDIYTADGTPFTAVAQSVGSVALTFEAQQADLAVSAVVWDFT
ncbi:MAG: hypothetical protein IKW90_07640 [Lachnospiraceae bacterium]|nr:hypothetical protein [Lachnospiraceae bacterium]